MTSYLRVRGPAFRTAIYQIPAWKGINPSLARFLFAGHGLQFLVLGGGAGKLSVPTKAVFKGSSLAGDADAFCS